VAVHHLAILLVITSSHEGGWFNRNSAAGAHFAIHPFHQGLFQIVEQTGLGKRGLRIGPANSWSSIASGIRGGLRRGMGVLLRSHHARPPHEIPDTPLHRTHAGFAVVTPIESFPPVRLFRSHIDVADRSTLPSRDKLTCPE
jgi:hypothetical protein